MPKASLCACLHACTFIGVKLIEVCLFDLEQAVILSTYILIGVKTQENSSVLELYTCCHAFISCTLRNQEDTAKGVLLCVQLTSCQLSQIIP